MKTLFKHRDPIGTGIYPLPRNFCDQESIFEAIKNSSIQGEMESIFYIHIPFCKKFCSYCGIQKFQYDPGVLDDYVSALEKEIAYYHSQFPERKLATVYFGGGTATSLSKENWKTIFSQLYKFEKIKNYEITIEGTPEGFLTDNLLFFRDNGVNRVSIGVQSLMGQVNQNLSRFYSLNSLDQIIDEAMSIIGNVNVDLIYNLPGQTKDSFENDLKKIDAMGITHLTINPFVVIKTAPIYKKMMSDTHYRPKEEMEIKLFKHALKILNDLGFTQYSVRDFYKDNKMCQYILRTAYCHDVIGLGFASYGFLNGTSYRNCATSIEDYISAIDKYGASISQVEQVTQEDFLNKIMIQGFRLTDFSMKKAEKLHGHSFMDIFNKQIEKVVKAGLVQINDGKIEYTYEGLIYANNIRAMFGNQINYLGFGLESLGDSNRGNYE